MAHGSNPGTGCHIIHVVRSEMKGGVFSYILSLAKTPDMAAYRHSVVCFQAGEGVDCDCFRRAGIPTFVCTQHWPFFGHRRPSRLWNLLWKRFEWTFPSRMAAVMLKGNADLVHSHIVSRLDLQAEAVVKRAGLPWVLTLHGFKLPHDERICQWQGALDTAAGGRFALTTVAKGVADDLAKCKLDRLPRIEVIHGGVNIERFNIRHETRCSLKAELGIPEDAVLFGAVGVLDPIKGFDILIEAAAILVQKGASAGFVVAGEGSGRADLVSKIKRLGLSGKFILLGWQADIAGFLAQIDVFVMPSRSEGCPIALIEALAAGLPCVASGVGGIPEVLDFLAGIIVTPESPVALAEGMEQLLSEPSRTLRSSFALENAKRFSSRECARRHFEIYDRLLLGSPC